MSRDFLQHQQYFCNLNNLVTVHEMEHSNKEPAKKNGTTLEYKLGGNLSLKNQRYTLS